MIFNANMIVWNTDMIYWLFSTIAQTIAAIIGLIGMVTVYKIQLIRNSSKEIMDWTLTLRKYVYGIDALRHTPHIFLKAVTRGLKNDHFNGLSKNDRFVLKAGIERLKQLNNTSKRIKGGFVVFTLTNFFTIFLSLIAIVFADHISAKQDVLFLTIVALLIFLDFILSAFTCFSLLRD